MFEFIYNGLKRILFGATTYFTVRSGSVPLNGSSFVSVYGERTKTPIKIVGIQFAVEPSSQGEWRVTVDGERIFPYGETNPLDSDHHSLVPIEIAAGNRFEVEVRSRNKEYRGIVILEELNTIELR